MSGPKTKPSEAIATRQTQVGEEGLTLGREWLAFAKEDRAKRDELAQPLIMLNKALSSGDRALATAILAPMIGEISRGYTGARESIFDTIADPTLRSQKLAELNREKYAATAGAVSEPFKSSFGTLAQIGSGYGEAGLAEGGVGLSGFGAGLRGFEGASMTRDTVMKAEAAKKQATMGFLGNIAQAAGGGFSAALAKLPTSSAFSVANAGAPGGRMFFPGYPG